MDQGQQWQVSTQGGGLLVIDKEVKQWLRDLFWRSAPIEHYIAIDPAYKAYLMPPGKARDYELGVLLANKRARDAWHERH